MSGNIDERIVEMNFQGSSFLSGIKSAVSALANLKNSLNGLKGAGSDIDNLEASSKRLSLSSIASGVSNISSKFSVMGAIGLSVFASLANRAVSAGISIVKSLTIDPLKEGLEDYENKINAIQTILANTGYEGTTLSQVTAVLNQLNTYANLTVYNFSQMAQAIGTFTAAGVGLKTSEESIKGIANLAALSGSSAQQAQSAMYQLSQAIAAGKVKLQDWNSVVNAGIGGKVFQNALINTARAAGVSIDAIIKKAGSFRQSLQSGWLTTKILTEALTEFTGDLSNAQLKSMGFTQAEIVAIQKEAKIAVDSATQVRTISALFQDLKEETGTAVASIFQALLGNINQVTAVLSPLHQTLENLLTNPIYDLSRYLTEWAKLGGRGSVIQGIENLWKDLSLVMGAVGKAFAKVFPPQVVKTVDTATQGFERLGSSFKTVKDSTTPVSNGLFNITQSFAKFTKDLTPSAAEISKLQGVFSVIFSVLKVGEAVFKAVIDIAGQIGPAFKKAFPPAVVTATQTMSQGFERLGGGLEKIPYKSAEDGFTKITDGLEKLATGLKPSEKTLSDFRIIFTGVFSAVKIVIDIVEDVLGGLFHGLSQIGGATSTAGGGLLGLITIIAQWITNARKALESSDALKKFFDDLGTILVLPIKGLGLLTEGLSKVASFLAPFISKIGAQFSKVGDAIAAGLKSGNFQNVVNILNSILLGSVYLTVQRFIQQLTKKSKDDAEKAGLLDTIKESFEGLTGALKAMQTNLKAGTLQKIAIAIGLLTASIVALSFVNVKNLTKSLTAMEVMFSQLLSAMATVAKISGTKGVLKMAIISAALNLLATSIVILSGAVLILSHLSWDQLARGLSAVAILLAELVGALSLMGENATGKLAGAYAMETMAVALNLMSVAVTKLGRLPWSVLLKGVGTIEVLLDIIAGFQKLGGGEKMLGSAAAMLIVAAALVIMGAALKSMGSMSWGQIGKSLTELGGALLIISIALDSMEEGLAGAAALAVAAVGLAILAKALKSMGGMSWGAIGKSLVELSGALLILAAGLTAMIVALPGAAALVVAAAALAILTPILVTLGGLSWEAIGKGLAALAGIFIVLGAAAIGLAIVTPILLAIGVAIALLGAGILASGIGIGLFAAGMIALAAAIAASGAAILSFVTDILDLLPVLGKELGLAVVAFAQAIGTGGVAITNAFSAIFSAVDKAIIKNLPLAEKAFQGLITAFITVINKDSGPIITAVLNLILKLLTAVGNYAGKFAKAGGQILVNFLNGVATEVPKVATAGTNIVLAFLKAVSNDTTKIANGGLQMVIDILGGITTAITTHAKQLHAAGVSLAKAIIDGIAVTITGNTSLGTDIINLAKNLASKFSFGLISKSPSKLFAAKADSIPQGVALGVARSTSIAVDSVNNMGNSMVDALGKSLSGISKLVDANMELNPKITPVVDLTQAKAGFSQLSALSKSQLIGATTSTASAATISAAIAAAQASATGQIAGGTTLQFNQYNTSPQALSAIDIYRRTKNQISVAKGVLAGNANASGNN